MKIRIVFLALLALLLSSCGEPAEISFGISELVMDIESACNLEADIHPEDREIEYFSTDSEVADFDDGLVIAHKAGVCALYAKCGDVVASPVTLTVRDFQKEAQKISEDIAAFYKLDQLDPETADIICDRFDELPEYAQLAVGNIRIAQIYASAKAEDRWVYTSAGGGKYHMAGCYRLGSAVKCIPYELALYEKKDACSVCHN